MSNYIDIHEILGYQSNFYDFILAIYIVALYNGEKRKNLFLFYNKQGRVDNNKRGKYGES